MTNPEIKPAANAPCFDITERNRVRRMHQYGSYVQADLYAVLDAAPLSHIGYRIDGQPFVTPTLHWRDGDRIYWHGSSASRFLRAINGHPVCLTATLMDGYVLARSMYNHTVNYRSAMAFGIAHRVEGNDASIAALRRFSDRFFPGRWDRARPPTTSELRATHIFWLEIEDASVKQRSGPPDDPEDAAWPIWAGVLPMKIAFASPEPAPDMPPTVTDGPPEHPLSQP